MDTIKTLSLSFQYHSSASYLLFTMNVYNSAGGLNQDDTDMTMINHSFIYGGNDESINSCIPIVRRQQANQSKSINNPSNSDDRNDYIEVNIRQIEQILNFYRQDLKQESKTQLDCNRQLITRLIDFLRPAYSSDENQMKNLDILYKEIFDLQDIRFIEQKEKNDQLSIQIRYLKKSIITTPIKDDDRDSLMTNVYQMSKRISKKNKRIIFQSIIQIQ